MPRFQIARDKVLTHTAIYSNGIEKRKKWNSISSDWICIKIRWRRRRRWWANYIDDLTAATWLRVKVDSSSFQRTLNQVGSCKQKIPQPMQNTIRLEGEGPNNIRRLRNYNDNTNSPSHLNSKKPKRKEGRQFSRLSYNYPSGTLESDSHRTWTCESKVNTRSRKKKILPSLISRGVFSFLLLCLHQKDKQQQVGRRRIIQDSLAYLNACLDWSVARAPGSPRYFLFKWKRNKNSARKRKMNKRNARLDSFRQIRLTGKINWRSLIAFRLIQDHPHLAICFFPDEFKRRRERHHDNSIRSFGPLSERAETKDDSER